MTEVVQLVPTPRTVEVADLVSAVGSAERVMPFSADRVAFVADLSRRLRRRSRGFPEAQALAYWLRNAELARLQAGFEALGSDHLVLVPRGTIFHIPPANVDTLFVYSWALATLLGNRNIVRLSSRSTDQASMLVDVLREVLHDHPSVSESTSMITYGHLDEITAAISSASDTRVVWGGDETVRRVRAVALPPHATELTFADRMSMAAVDSRAYLDLEDPRRDELAERFFNDCYFFDQMGCSSPRLLIWVGDVLDTQADFRARLHACAARKGYQVGASTAIAKLGQAYSTMIDADVRAYHHSSEATVLELDRFHDVRGAFSGGGFFYQVAVDTVDDIAPFIQRPDQTLAVFGVPGARLSRLVKTLRGRGIDRIVPIGKALEFSRFWDGYDLLAEFTRKVSIDAALLT